MSHIPRRVHLALLAMSASALLSACGTSSVTTAKAQAATTSVATTIAPTTSYPTTTTAPPTTAAPIATAPIVTAPIVTAPIATAATVPATPVMELGGWIGRKPTTINFSVDGGNVISNIVWSHWGQNSANGSGAQIVESCVPSCASGAVSQVLVTINLSAPSSGMFTQMTTSEPTSTQLPSSPQTGPWGS